MRANNRLRTLAVALLVASALSLFAAPSAAYFSYDDEAFPYDYSSDTVDPDGPSASPAVLDGTTDVLETSNTSGQVAGGDRVNTGFSYTVAISHFGRVICGGWLYSDQIVVTSSHCLPRFGALTVLTEQYDLSVDTLPSQEYEVLKAVEHPNYDENANDYDVALLKLDRPVEGDILPAKLVGNLTLAELSPGTRLTVLGWGTSTADANRPSRYLLSGVVTYEPAEDCQKAYPEQVITSRMTCTRASNNQDACTGDGGGPLVLLGDGIEQDEVVGIVSWGDGCNIEAKPGVYTSMAGEVRSWIQGQAATL